MSTDEFDSLSTGGSLATFMGGPNGANPDHLVKYDARLNFVHACPAPTGLPTDAGGSHHAGEYFDRPIIGLPTFRVTEFGTRVSFKIESAERCCVACCAAGDVAQEFIAHYCEGDVVAVSGIYKPRPSTASSNTSWAGRSHVRAGLYSYRRRGSGTGNFRAHAVARTA